MTDNEILKALECMAGDEIECSKCAYHDIDRCRVWVPKDAIDLINRQKAEIEQLNQKYDLAVAEREANVKGFTEELAKARAEVERLQAEINAYSLAKKYDAEHFMADIKTLQMENNTLIKKRDVLLQSYARGIFEELERTDSVRLTEDYWKIKEVCTRGKE